MFKKYIVVFFLVPVLSQAQEKNSCRVAGFVMYNRMWHTYHTNVNMKHAFGFSDVKGGLLLAKPLRTHLEFRTGLGIGIQYSRSNAIYPFGGNFQGPDDKPETFFN